jgi:choline dehydrogenase
MIGEKASDHILGRSLAPSNLVPWINPAWETSQR